MPVVLISIFFRWNYAYIRRFRSVWTPFRCHDSQFQEGRAVTWHLKLVWIQNFSSRMLYQILLCFLLPNHVHIYIYIYIYIYIIIIIMSCGQHRYLWPCLSTSPYHSSPMAGLQGYIPYPHIAAVCMFELVVLLLIGHIRGSTGVHHLRARPCFSSSVRYVWFV